MIDIRLPNLQGKSDSEKVRQLTSYIYQLAEQLNFHINTMDEEIKKAGSGSGGGSTVIIQGGGGGGSAGLGQSEVEAIVSKAISSSLNSAVSDAVSDYYESVGLANDGTTIHTTSGLHGSFSGYTVTGEFREDVEGYLYTAINGQGTYYYVFADNGFNPSESLATFVLLTKYTT